MINWRNIRIHNNSQNNAFEELVCQFARRDCPSNNKKFMRLGAPDGGVECFWEMIDGSKIGWQAKYVFTIEDLISQADNSIKTAMKNHPTMVKYIIATPFNLPDPHYTGKGGKPVKSANVKWSEKVEQWKKELSKEGNLIEIELWDESYLNDLLIKPQNEGLRYYWFNGSEFTFERFKVNLDTALADLGPRYTPELNITLETSSYFDYLIRNERSIKAIQKYHIDLKRVAEDVLPLFSRTKKFTDLSKEYAELSKLLGEIYEMIKIPSYFEMQDIRFSDLIVRLTTLEDIVSSMWEKIEDNLRETEFRNSDYERTLNQMFVVLNEGKKLFSLHIELINYPFLILHGEPGIGKSHLLADVCLKQVQKGIPAILLLGDQFSKSVDPRENIKQRMQYSGSFTSLLQLINSIGQIHEQRILIAIDALNEGEGTDIWLKYLAGLETEIKNYRWIALAVSVRTDYIQDIIPDKCREQMTLIEHQGFYEVYDFACEYFFEHYGLDIRVPTFNNEFNNPLFLKLFCESCKDIGYKQELPSLPKVLEGYVNHLNEKLYRKFKYEKSLDLVRVAVEQLAEALVLSDSYSIPYSELQRRVDTAINRSLGNASPPEYFSFVDALIKEGIFRAFSGYKSVEKSVSFAYDRMKDYNTLLYWLRQKPEGVDIAEYVGSSTFFEKVLENGRYRHHTMLELLAIILPESYKKEIVECIPDGKISQSTLRAFLKSFQWRTTIYNASKIGTWLIDISKDDVGLKTAIIDDLLPVAAVPQHPFNMEFIAENFLLPESMAQLDAWWTPYINNKYDDYEYNVYKRIVKWCWRIDRKHPIDSNTRFLFGLTLSWLCSSSNRALRDSATKGLTCIYLDHVDEINKLLNTMRGVNDIYIIERIYAAAYGAVVYATENDKVKALSDHILDNFFNTNPIYPNILIRDYARGIVEYSINCGNYDVTELGSIKSRIAPPYGSLLPEKFPSDEDIKLLKDKYNDSYGFSSISYSMDTGQNYGDFGRYTFRAALDDFIGVDINNLERWCLSRIVELGYDPHIHDNQIPRYSGRGSNRIERIGKKYQWIVFHEILALVADNYHLEGENWWQDRMSAPYAGPWNPNVRDIDPTLLIGEKKGLRYKQPPKSWFSNFDYLPVDKDEDEWIKEDFSFGENLLHMVDPEGVEWVALCSYPFWNEYPADFAEDNISEKKSMRAYIFSYITDYKMPHKFDVDKMNELSWYNIYAGEFYWAPAYKDNQEAYGVIDWEKIKINNSDSIDIMQTTQRYIWEKGTDYSKEDSIAFDIPTEYIFTSMGLRGSSKPGYYYLDDTLVCMNPSIDHEANHQLLIRKDALCNWLEEKNLRIYWRIKIEKYISTGRTHNTKKWSHYVGWYYLDGQKIMGETELTDRSNRKN
ncbi:MAG TPA: hypothetical protein GX707_06560 [Epulopiscium sp.]|nr:hypothetical protein [Candidatus Epulonipiscium sp.]